MAEELSHGALEIAARHHYVDNAVLEEKLGGLESFGQLLPNRLLDHAWSSKSDHRPGLGQDRVAEHREAGADAAGRWIGEDRHVRNPPLGQLRQNRRCLRHLHEGEYSFLHAGAA